MNTADEIFLKRYDNISVPQMIKGLFEYGQIEKIEIKYESRSIKYKLKTIFLKNK